MASGRRSLRRWFRFSLRTLLLLCIPVGLFTGLATWLLRPPPVDVEVTVERFSWYKDLDGSEGLGAEVRVTNRSKSTMWYLEDPAYHLWQLVDGEWSWSSTGSRPAWGWGEQGPWSEQGGMESRTLLVGPISEKAATMVVAIPCTTDKIAAKAHWIFSPEVQIERKGNDYSPKTGSQTNVDQWRLKASPFSPDGVIVMNAHKWERFGNNAIFVLWLAAILVSFVCYVSVVVAMFRERRTRLAVACLGLTLACGIGYVVALVCGWRICRRRLMIVWTLCLILWAVLLVVMTIQALGQA